MKLREAPSPRGSQHCRWCSHPWYDFNGARLCFHCDASHTREGCPDCAYADSLTDTRELDKGGQA